jgi:hypothetical protein
MISIPRSRARQFRAVARRAGLSKAGLPGSACVRLQATVDALKLQASNGHVAIEHCVVGQFTPADVTVPIQLFVDCEAKSDALVMIRLEESGRVVAAWDDRGVPQTRDYDVPKTIPELPPVPSEWASNGPDLLVALCEANATADNSATRYSLDCLQLKGSTGTISATDSHQLLIQSGFRFPWQDEVLVRATSVFTSSELPSSVPVEIGRTEQAVAVRVGEWTIIHEIYREGRFPNLDRTIPTQDAIATRMRVDATDAKFLTDTVNRLPADDQIDRPVTLELNGEVVLRARKDGQSPMTELVLTRSQRIGNQLRLQTNREFLARAFNLGFTEVGFVDDKSPCVCRDANRTYVWMLLEPQDALASSEKAQRIESWSVLGNGESNGPTHNTKLRRTARNGAATAVTTVVPLNRVAEHLPSRSASRTNLKADVVPDSPVPKSTDVIEQALELRNQLRSVVQGLTDLVSQIRRQRKQNRIMRSTLQSLKQLQLLEA